MDVWPRWVEHDDYLRVRDEDEQAAFDARKKKQSQLAAAKVKVTWSEHPLPIWDWYLDVIFAAKVEDDVTALFIEKDVDGQTIRELIAHRMTTDETKSLIVLQQGKGSWELHRLFLDPTGQHIIASFRSGETWYCNSLSGKKGNIIERLSNKVSAVGWDKQNKRERSTGLVLLGDSRGCVYVARFDREEGCTFLRMAMDLSRQMDSPAVTGIHVEKDPQSGKLIVLVSTATRLYEFVGGPTLLDLFPPPRGTVPKFVKLHPGACDTAGGLVFYRPDGRDGRPSPQANIAWCSTRGIYHANVVVDPAAPQQSIIRNGSAFAISQPAPADAANAGGVGTAKAASAGAFSSAPVPGSSQISKLKIGGGATQRDPEKVLGVVLGETFMLILFQHCLCLVAQPAGLRWRGNAEPHDRIPYEDLRSRTLWSKSTAIENPFEPVALVQNAVRTGPDGDAVFLVTVHNVYKIEIESEQSISTWKSFLSRALDQNEPDRGQYFLAASKILGEKESEKLEQVRIRAADYYFESGQYATAAELYATSKVSFEDTVMKFVQCGDKRVLLAYLTARIEFIKDRSMLFSQERSQLSCLATWTTKVYLDVLCDTPDGHARTSLRDTFYDFVKKNLKHIVRSVVNELLSEYQMPSELLWFGKLTRNYTTIVQFYVAHGQYDAALNVLETHCKDTEEHLKLWYQFSPMLITKVPVKLVDAWMDYYELEAGKELISALIKYHPKYNPPGVTENQAIKYLKWLVELQDNRDQAIHNLLIQIYIQQEEDEEEAVDYLRECQMEGIWFFDEKYALRLCLQNEKHRSAVCIYSLLGHYSDAVALAIKTNSIDLAKRVAREPGEEALRKRLALQIVEYVIHRDRHDARVNSTKTAIDMVNEFKDIQLEDILPFLKQDVIIAGVAKELLQVVEGYTTYLEDLKLNMTDITDAAKGIQGDIDRIREHAVHIPENATCCLCDGILLARNNFYAFACTHMFHQDCLRREIRKSDGITRHMRDRITELAQVVEEGERRVLAGEVDQGMQLIQLKLKVVEAKKELDTLVAAQCPYCGDMKILEASLPFLDDVDDSWDVVQIGEQPTRQRR